MRIDAGGKARTAAVAAAAAAAGKAVPAQRERAVAEAAAMVRAAGVMCHSSDYAASDQRPR